MKKRLLLLSMVSIVALVGCDIKQLTDPEGNQVIVTLGDGTNYTANELFKNYSKTSTGASQYYNAVYDVLIRAVQPKTSIIQQYVAKDIDDFVQAANDAATQNNTSKKTELSKKLEAEGVDSLDELEQVYYLKRQKETYETNYYDTNLNDSLLEEYINYYAPYHVRHILVKTSSGDSLYKGTITADDAINLSDMVTRLSSGRETFGVIAQSTADNGDSGSAAIYGDVGVMSTQTEFVSEFKYALYQYDTFYNDSAKANVAAFDARQAAKENEGSSLIPVNESEKQFLKDSVNRIPYQKFVDLRTYANATTENVPDATVNGKEEYYPRNILFNQYINNHALGVVIRGTASAVASSSRFRHVEGLSASSNASDDVLCDEAGRPILVTRAGTGSSDSGYQGIHFIIAQRSPFVEKDATDDKTLIEELKSYWDMTTYSTDDDVSGIDSYITFIDSSRSEYSTRATDLKNLIKGFDSYVSYRIYEQALKEAEEKYQSVTFGEGIKELIDDYLSSNRSNAAYSAKESYENSWDAYIKLLKIQEQVSHLKISEDEIEKYFGSGKN